MDESTLRRALEIVAQEIPFEQRFPDLKRRSRLRLLRNALFAVTTVACLTLAVPFVSDLTRSDPAPITPAPSPPPSGLIPPPGEISFISHRGGQALGFFSINTDGTNLTSLFGGRFETADYDWSPDGQQFAFTVGLSEGHGAIYIADLEAEESYVVYTDEERTRGLLNPQTVTWVTGRSRLAFTSTSGDLYWIRTDGTDLQLLLDGRSTSENACPIRDVDWGPDAMFPVIARECEDGGLNLFNPSSGVLQQVTTIGSDRDPTWSPDGRFVAFTRGTAEPQIAIVEPATGNLEAHQLTEEVDNYDPNWSPDGSTIVFGSNRSGKQDIYIMSADGESEMPLTDDNAADFAPAWRPET